MFVKTIRTKILFTILLFSAVAPFEMQAGLGRAAFRSKILKTGARSSYNFFKKHSYVESFIVKGGLGCVLVYFSSIWLEKTVEKRLERVLNAQRGKLLAKLEEKELINDSKYEGYYLTSLEPELMEEARDALKNLDIPDSLIKKMLIVGRKYEKECPSNPNRARSVGATLFFARIPYAIMFDVAFLKKASFWDKKFCFFHEAGHVAAYHEGVDEPNNKELNELTADCYALRAFTRGKNNVQLFALVHSLAIHPKPYLSFEELVCYGSEMFRIQRGGGKVNPSVYARKIFDDRKEDGYKGRVRKEADRLLDACVCKKNSKF